MSATPAGARATLVLSLSMTFLGIMGAGKSAMALGSEPPASLAADPSVPPATAELTQRGVEIWIGSPVRKAATIANLLASSLLMAAGFLLTVRRASAMWWATQALVANAIYAIGDAAGSLWILRQHAAELTPLAERHIAAQTEVAARAEGLDPAATPSPLSGGQFLMTLGGLAIGYAVLMVLVYVLLWRISRRADVRRFLERSTPSAE